MLFILLQKDQPGGRRLDIVFCIIFVEQCFWIENFEFKQTIRFHVNFYEKGMPAFEDIKVGCKL